MTQNQIRYLEYLENARHNQAFEGLTSRGQDLSLLGTQTMAAANRYGAELSAAAHRYSAELSAEAMRYSTNAGFLTGMGNIGTNLLPWFFVPARDRNRNNDNSRNSGTPSGGMLALPAPSTDYTREEKIRLTEEANRRAGELRKSGALQAARDFFTGFVDYSLDTLNQAADLITDSSARDAAFGSMAGVFGSMPAWMWAIG